MMMAVQEPYILMVQPDDITINPRELDAPLGTMVCFHSQYSLGDNHKYDNKDDFLYDLFLKTVGDNEQGEQKYESLCSRIYEHPNTPYGSFDYVRALDAALLDEIEKKFIMLPLYLYDHSGLVMNTTGFSCPWDSGQVGWIYVSESDAMKAFDSESMTMDVRQKAESFMRNEVAVYDSYLRGECYGFELYKNGELTDSCWGFIGELTNACKAMADYLPDECKSMIESLEEKDHPKTIIKTLLRHAKMQVEQAAKDFSHKSRQQEIRKAR